MADVGSAYVTLMPSMRGFANDIKAQFGQAGNDGGKSFGSGLTAGILGGSGAAKSALSSIGGAAATAGKLAVAGLGAVTGAVTAVGGAALGAYADYEQLSGGVETLFGSSASTLKGYADEAYRTAGMSANQYMTQATSFAASLVQSVGGDTAKAAEYANMAMVDMSDNVNKMGSNMQSVQDAYQGFAKQNFTMLDNLKLGYGGTKEEMQRLIADANKFRAEQGKTADLTIESYADIVEAIHTVQEEMGITGTTAKEASTTISGSIGMAKAAWTNFLTGLGRDDVDFSQLTTQLLESIGTVAKNVAPPRRDNRQEHRAGVPCRAVGPRLRTRPGRVGGPSHRVEHRRAGPRWHRHQAAGGRCVAVHGGLPAARHVRRNSRRRHQGGDLNPGVRFRARSRRDSVGHGTRGFPGVKRPSPGALGARRGAR